MMKNSKLEFEDKMINFTKSIFALISISFFTTIFAFDDWLTIHPSNPTENDIIQIGIQSYGPADCFLDFPKPTPSGLEQIIYKNAHDIALYIAGEPRPTFIPTPNCTARATGGSDIYYELGKLPAGDYNLTLNLSDYRIDFAEGKFMNQFKQKTFSVKRSNIQKTKTVPSLSIIGLLTLLLMLLLMAGYFFTQNKSSRA